MATIRFRATANPKRVRKNPKRRRPGISKKLARKPVKRNRVRKAKASPRKFKRRMVKKAASYVICIHFKARKAPMYFAGDRFTDKRGAMVQRFASIDAAKAKVRAMMPWLAHHGVESVEFKH